LSARLYGQQWHVFPKPLNAEAVGEADVILISQGHEDHFHARTLRSLGNKSARLFYPYSWFGGAKEFIESLGFKDVREAVNFRKYNLTKKTSVTYVANGRDNGYIKENPRRVFSYLIRQPPVRTWKSWKKSASRIGNVNYDRSVWLLKDADELRERFGLPKLLQISERNGKVRNHKSDLT
jgi:hypothetical protein